MVDPGTAMLITAAIAAAAKGGGDYLASNKEKKAGKRRAKETRRETYAGLLGDELQRGSELHAHRLGSRGKIAKRKSQISQDTSDVVRGAFNI